MLSAQMGTRFPSERKVVTGSTDQPIFNYDGRIRF